MQVSSSYLRRALRRPRFPAHRPLSSAPAPKPEAAEHVLKNRSNSGGPRLEFASGFWADASSSLSPEFMGLAGYMYGSAAEKADFKNKDPENRLDDNS
uniref:Uncharacterized protein n=1 Tax=Oryza meridionalis TaxID=40149 RepID=A0A0E0F3U4_9ORYZ